jgi:hypothetical protein
MKSTIHFYLLNYDFSPEFAEAHHDGNPSENNRLYDWEDELSLTSNTTNIEVLRNETYFLIGERGDGTSFKEAVPNMFLLVFYGDGDEQTIMGCSESLLESYKMDKATGEYIVKVVMSENFPLSNPVPGIYIASNDFPKSLITPDEHA